MKKKEIKERFPEPFYKIVDTNAVAVYGNYVPELFEIKKRGVLTARGLFGKHDLSDTSEIREVKLEEIERYNVSNKEKKALLNTWHEFLDAIKANNSKKIRELSLDSVICAVCEGFASPHFYNDVEPVDTFITTAYRNFPDTELWKSMIRGKTKISATKYPERQPAHFQLHNAESLIIYELIFEIATKYGEYEYRQRHSFQFVKIYGEFKFYGMEAL